MCTHDVGTILFEVKCFDDDEDVVSCLCSTEGLGTEIHFLPFFSAKFGTLGIGSVPRVSGTSAIPQVGCEVSKAIILHRD